MKRLTAIALLAFLQPAHALDIAFDYSADSSGFFASSVRRDTLEAAAAVFESRLADTLDAITPGTGANTYTLSASHPSGGSQIELVNQPIAQNEIRIFVGARNIGSLGFASSAFSVSGTSSAFVNMVVGRGQSGALSTPPTDFGPWGGSIAFRSTSSWHDSHTSAVASDRFDLYSVALHEIGHLLGVGQAGSWDAQVSGLQFTGAAASALQGGPIPLADDGHWAASVVSTINGAGSFETAMDPEIVNGARKPFTDLDWAALQDIGWQVTPIPEPQTWITMLAGLALLSTALRRRAASGTL